MPITADFNGLPLLYLPPDLTRESPAMSVGVDVDEFTGDTGGAVQESVGGLPNVLREHTWSFESRVDYWEFEDFLFDRAGRYAPFWMPSWADDLHVLSGAFGDFTIRWMGYTEKLFPSLAHRRTIIHRNGNPADYSTREITAAVDNGDGTETLSGFTGVGFTNLPTAQGHRHMFLHLCRLDADDITVDYASGENITVKLNVLTIPEES
jgi:hypothetical protein